MNNLLTMKINKVLFWKKKKREGKESKCFECRKYKYNINYSISFHILLTNHCDVKQSINLSIY